MASKRAKGANGDARQNAKAAAHRDRHVQNSSRSRDLRQIEIIGAQEHNLQVPALTLPKQSLIVFTGVSGSGKSSLAFDTLYAEGQRRYVESLSAYARQFLGRLDRPEVEHIRGLSPTIAIEQKAASGNPRSTVGTITEIYDYLRVLYARAGQQFCHHCGSLVQGRTAPEIVSDIQQSEQSTTVLVLAPLIVHRKGEFREIFQNLAARGFTRVRVDGALLRLEDVPALDKKRKHTVELVVDRVTCSPENRRRLTESVELALRESGGEVTVVPESGPPRSFSESRTCCGHAFAELSPQSFSFNSPLGMCLSCNGLGRVTTVDPELVIPDRSLSIRDGAIKPWASAMERGEGWQFRIIQAMSEATGVDLDTPFGQLSKKHQNQVLYGIDGERLQVTWGDSQTGSNGTFGVRFEGVLNLLMRRYQETSSTRMREHYRRYLVDAPCEACGGKRLRPEHLSVRIEGRSIAEVTAMTVAEAYAHVQQLELSENQARIAEGVLREISGRLRFLLDVGLEYLTLDRAGPTLSGGEAQRIRLASQLGSELSGVMYVLDEPSIGLHQRDNQRLIETLFGLRDLGNTVIVVEHDEETIRAADHVVDFGPGAGRLGGQVVFSGTPKSLLRSKGLTGQYLSGRRRIETPRQRRTFSKKLKIHGARANNLKGIDVEIPLGVFVCVSGVSGAGKSSLVHGILLPALARKLHGGTDPVGAHKKLTGLKHLDKVIAIDQRPIGRTPRSNPGTYTKAFDEIRQIFAQLPESRELGWSAGRFSFNVKGGRCEACQGDGTVRVEMHFLADVYVPCEVCGGLRYNAQTLNVRYRGDSIADILNRSVDECRELFASYPKLSRILQTLQDVGLGYMKIGQPAPTMSGGEAQRVKLSRELAKAQTGRTLYVLDEPTTGLHFEDIRKLLSVLQRLVDLGNTVLVVEHNLDVIQATDWVIDLGPEGGKGGGTLVASGTPEEVVGVAGSHTGRFLLQRA
ncbi:MAG: excinuclease ABC subunit UvrA [Myxococcota bacterium]